jgi:hypothetical protein
LSHRFSLFSFAFLGTCLTIANDESMPIGECQSRCLKDLAFMK